MQTTSRVCWLWTRGPRGCKSEVGVTQAPVELQEKKKIKTDTAATTAAASCAVFLGTELIRHFDPLTWDGSLWIRLLLIFDGRVPQGVMGE